MCDRRYDDEQRWRDALSVLDGQPTDAALRRGRDSHRILIAMVVLPLVVGAVTGLLVTAHGTHHQLEHMSSSPVAQVVGWSLTLSGMIVIVWGAVLVVRARRGDGLALAVY